MSDEIKLWGFPIRTAPRTEILLGIAQAGKVTVSGGLIFAQVGDRIFVDFIDPVPSSHTSEDA